MESTDDRRRKVPDAAPAATDPAFRQRVLCPTMTAKETRDSLDELLENAPIDPEAETDEERRAVAEGRDALRRGKTVSLDAIRAELAPDGRGARLSTLRKR